MFIELVEDWDSHLAPFQLDDDPDALPVRLVLHVRYAFDLLLVHKLYDGLDESCLIDLIGYLCNNDYFAPFLF